MCITTINGASSSASSRIDSMLKVARTSKIDSVVLYNYAFISRRMRHLPYDTIKRVLKEGLNFAKDRNIENEYTFQIRYAEITSDFLRTTHDSVVQRIHKVLPFSKNLPAKYRIRAYRHLGSQHHILSQFDSAIYYYDKGIQEATETENTLDIIHLKSMMALTYHYAGNTDISFKLLEEIKSKYPMTQKSYHFRRAFVTVNMSLQNYQECIDLYLSIREKYSLEMMMENFPAVCKTYPEALYKQGQYISAIEESNKLLNINQDGIWNVDNNEFIFTLAKSYLALKKPQKSLDIFKETYQKNGFTLPERLNSIFARIKCEAFIELGLQDSSRKYLDRYVALEKEESLNKAKIKYQQTLVEYETKEVENQVELLANKLKVDKSRFKYLLLAGGIFLLGISSGIYAYFKRRQEKNKSALVEAELTSIRSQMNPHFMFNALNSIKSFIIKEEPKLAAEYLSRFASLIRRILDLSSQQYISLAQELETLDLYVEMEKARFQNKFEYQITSNINIASNNVLVPPLFLQPFLENAIKHGLSPLTHKKGLLELTINQVDNKLTFAIRDNGIGRQIKDSDHKSKGVSLSLNRIELWNEGTQIKNHLKIIDLENNDEDSTPAGTEVQIEIIIKPKE